MRFLKCWAFLAIFTLFGCAKTENIVPEELLFDQSKGQLEAVELIVEVVGANPNVFAPTRAAFEKALKESGVFHDIGHHVHSPFVFHATLVYESDIGLAKAAGGIITAGLVPIKINGTIELDAVLYAHGAQAERYLFDQDFTLTFSLYNMKEWENFEHPQEQQAAVNLAHQLINGLVDDDALPRVQADEFNIPITKGSSTIRM